MAKSKSKAQPYKIVQKRNKRYEVKKRGGGTITGEEKVKILKDAGILKAVKSKKVEPKEEAPAADAPAES